MASNIDLSNIYIKDELISQENSNNSNIDDWAQLINQELDIEDKLMESTNSLVNSKLLLSTLKTSIILNDKNLTLVEILNLDFTNLDFIKIHEYTASVIKYLKNNTKLLEEINENNNYSNFMEKINWLINVYTHINNKYKYSDVIIKKEMSQDCIPRSSYKFCKYNYECKYFIKNNKFIDSCFEQHIVDNYVLADLKILRNYLETYKENLNITEMNKSINTLFFVINHIRDEIKNIDENIDMDINKISFDKTNLRKEKKINKSSN